MNFKHTIDIEPNNLNKELILQQTRSYEPIKNSNYVILIFFGHVNSGKSSLIKTISGKQTKVTLNGNYNLAEIDYYWNDSNPNLIYADTGGFVIGRQSGSSRLDMENFIDDLTKSVRKNFLLLTPEIDENACFRYVYVLLGSNGNLSKHYILALDYLNKKKCLWFMLVSKIDIRLRESRTESEKYSIIDKKKKEIFMQLRCIPKELLRTRLFFVSVLETCFDCKWNQLKELKLKFDNSSYLFFNYERELINNHDLDIDINIGIV